MSTLVYNQITNIDIQSELNRILQLFDCLLACYPGDVCWPTLGYTLYPSRDHEHKNHQFVPINWLRARDYI
jgi:hypothetical protein